MLLARTPINARSRDANDGRQREGDDGALILPPLTGLVAWTEPRNPANTIITGTAVDVLAGKLPTSRNATAPAAGNRPVYNAADANFRGKASMTGAATKCTQFATASAWRFVHDGTGMTIAIVVYSREAGNNYLISSQGASGANAGLSLYPIASSNLRLAIGNGAATVIQIDTTGSLFTASATHLVVVQYSSSGSPKAAVYVDGASAGTTNTEGAVPTAGDPVGPLNINGAGTGAASGADADHACLLAYNAYLSASALAGIRRYTRARFGTP